VEGGKLRKSATAAVSLPDLPAPALPAISGTHNVVITGVGGTGVVTVGAVLAMAAHVEGMGAGMMEMAGLAQKGGAVHIHLRLAARPADISAIRVAVGEADCVIGGDLVVTAGAKTLGLMRTGRTGAVVNSHEIVTGEFTRNRDFRLPAERLRLGLQARLGDKVAFFDASELTRKALGDSIYSNMAVLGAAWQQGLLPLSHAAISRSIVLNGAAPEANQRAFELGRWAVAFPDQAARLLAPTAAAAETDPIEARAAHLAAYQNAALAARFRVLLNRAPESLRLPVAKGYHKLLAYKDEYEVARLHLESAAKAQAEFEGDLRLTYHLAPPLLSRMGPDGRPVKRAFGPWIMRAFRLLARLKGLRGTRLDPFGYLPERRLERALIAQYEADMAEVLAALTPATLGVARELAELPLSIRGFGPLKEAAAKAAATRREALLATFRAGGTPQQHAAE
jgi:indolepyruvate ferredoxin oxidoreductase